MSKLLANDSIFDNFFDLINDYSFVLDHEGNILKANIAAINALGYSQDELHKMNVLDIHPQNRRQEVLTVVGNMLDGDETICTIPLLTKSQCLLPVKTRFCKSQYNNQEVIIGISEDLTALNVANERFRTIFDNNPTVMAISDFETGEYFDLNKAFTKILGYEKSEVIGKKSSNIFGEMTPSLRRQIYLDFEIKGRVENIRIDITKKDGTILKGLFFGEIIESENKKFTLTILYDLTNYYDLINQLQISEDRWNNALAGSGSGVWDWNLQDNSVFFSTHWKEMLGYDDHEVENKIESWENLVHPDDIKLCYEEISKYLRGEVDYYKNTHRLKAKDGSWRWILDSGKIVEYSSTGSPVRFVGTHRDITHEKESELELTEQKQWVSTILDSAKAGIVIIDSEKYLITDINTTACSILGKEYNEIIHTHCSNHLCSDIKECCFESMQDVDSINSEMTIINELGNEIHLLKTVNKKLFKNKLYYIESFIDISERIRSEKILAEKSSELENFFETMIDLLLISDIDGNMIRFNKQWEKLLGLSSEEISKCKFFDFIHPDDFEKTNLQVQKLLNHEKVVNFSNRYKCSNGEYKNIEWLAVRRNDLFYSSARDVTQQINDRNEILNLLEKSKNANRIIESNLEQKNILVQELEETSRKLSITLGEKDKFLSVLAHDLRAPLNGFLDLTKMMSEQIYDFSMKEMQEISTNLKNSADNLSELLENLFDWTMVNRGLALPSPIKVDLNEMVSKSILILQPSILSKSIELKNKIENKEFYSFSDLNMTQSVIRNIITNAVKFTNHNGTIVVELNDEANNWAISITDSGIGIPEDILNNLFVLSEKTSRNGTNGEKSTGMGLILCKEYLALNNGDISITSKENVGTKVVIKFPKFIN